MNCERKEAVGETGLHHNHEGKASRTDGRVNLLNIP